MWCNIHNLGSIRNFWFDKKIFQTSANIKILNMEYADNNTTAATYKIIVSNLQWFDIFFQSSFLLWSIPLIKTINLILHFSKIHNAENIKLEVYTYLPKF